MKKILAALLLFPIWAFAQVQPPGTTIPSQAGQNGNFLTTNGSALSWAAVSGGGAFSALTSGTNTAAAMLVGTGASLGPTGSGTISATAAPLSGLTGLATGVATFLATPTSANLAGAITDETGTGANVFANGPTLIAPILGTPASGTLTNATGLPLTTGVTGLLPVANGGNGTATPANTASAGVAVSGSWPAQAFSVDQTFSPVWSSLHTWSRIQTANTALDAVAINTATAATVGNQMFSPDVHFTGNGWSTTSTASQPVDCRMYLVPVQGATNPSGNLTVDCQTNNLGYATVLTIPSATSGVLTSAAQAFFQNVRVNGAAVPTVGIYNPGTINQNLGFAVNGAAKGQIGNNGALTLLNGILDTGTKFTAVGTGCTVGTTTGGSTTGTFVLGTGCTAMVVTLAGATGITAANGYSCQAHDRTTPTVLIGGESSSTTTTATFTIPAGAVAADVISYHCDGF